MGETIAARRDLSRNESITVSTDGITQMAMTAVIESAASIRMKKVYYPHWRLTNGEGGEVELRPDPQTGLLLFELPPGRHELTLDRRILPVEAVGMLVSLLTLLGVLAGLWALRTQKRPA